MIHSVDSNPYVLQVDSLDKDHLSNLVCAYHGSFGSVVTSDEVKAHYSDWKKFSNLDELRPDLFGQIFKAKANKDPNTLSYDEAMNDEHIIEWREAAAKEIKQLSDKKCWEECLKSEAKAKGEPIIPCTWVFRVKFSPSGDPLKRKSRICLRGDLM